MLRLLFVFVMAVTATSQAIVIRHDRDDSQYRQLAQDYPVVCRVGQGMGTLIDSLWVITAAHVVDGQPPNTVTVRFGDREIAVLQIEIHPDYARDDSHRDMALLRLAEPVRDITAALLYRSGDELGQRVTFVGDGRTGDGLESPADGERILRAAHNVVDSVRSGWLVFTFDAPPAGEDLEGISGPGDSGGPALVQSGDTLFIVGISAYNDGDPEGFYGSHEYYCRVSDELEWIESVMTGWITTDTEPRLMRFGQEKSGKQTASREEVKTVEIPASEDAPFVTILGKLIESIESDSVDDYIALFTSRFVDQRRQEADLVTAMHGFLVNATRVRGPIAGFHPLAPKGYLIPDSDYPMRPVIFHLQDGTSGYFGIALDDSGKIDHLSAFIKEGICPSGENCPEMTSLEDLIRTADR